MPERIREASLPVCSPRGLVHGHVLDVRRTMSSRAVDQVVGIVDEYLDPRGGQPDFGRARLTFFAWYCFVQKERRATQVEPGHPIQVPQLSRAERCPVPTDRSAGVRHDQHD